jgi:hypothetical protein
MRRDLHAGASQKTLSFVAEIQHENSSMRVSRLLLSRLARRNGFQRCNDVVEDRVLDYSFGRTVPRLFGMGATSEASIMRPLGPIVEVGHLLSDHVTDEGCPLTQDLPVGAQIRQGERFFGPRGRGCNLTAPLDKARCWDCG